jgi:hypothetical protein
MANTHFNMGVSEGDGSYHAFKEKIPVMQKRNEERRSNMGNKGENIIGNTFLNIGVSGGKGSQSTIKKKLSSKMEKSIYVGQWDSIKEKMIWQEREKGDEVAGIPKLVNSNSHVEEFFTPAKPTNEEGPNKEKRAHKSSGKKTKVSQGRLPQAGGSKVSLHMDTLEGKKEALELSGKRKKQGEF